jgi:hypothetical protein
MLSISSNLQSKLLDEHSKKIFIVRIDFPDNIRYYTTDSFIINDPSSGKNIFCKGSIQSNIQYKESYDHINNSVSVSSISIELFDDELDLFELSKTVELNLIEAFIYFGADNLDFDDYIELFHGIVRVNEIGLIGDSISLSIENIDDKYDKLFPPLKLSDQLTWTDLRFDAEKYNGESIPIIYGSIDEPGLPIPLYYDDDVIKKYVVANHNLSNVQVYGDGELINPLNYSASYEPVNSIYKIEPGFIAISSITISRNGQVLNPIYYSVTDLGGGNFSISVLPPPPVVTWQVEVDFGSGFELVPFDKAHEYYRAFDTYRLYVHVDSTSDPIQIFGNGEEVTPLQITYTPVAPSGYQAEIRVRSIGIGEDTYEVLISDEIIDNDFYTVTFQYNYNEYIIDVTGYNYYNAFFKGKKITASCDGLLSTTQSLPNVIDHLLKNYSNLPVSRIDSTDILSKTELNNFKVNRFFNGDSTLFETINELSQHFPFILTNRGLKKSINSTLINTGAIFDLVEFANLFDRNKKINITGPQEIYNAFSVRYKYNALDNRWAAFEKRDRTNDSQCQASYVRVNIDKELKTFELFSVNDDITAIGIINYKIDLFTRFHYIFLYLCKHDTIVLEEADKILVNDSEYAFVNKKFIVIGKVIDQDFVQLKLMSTEI